MSYSEIISEIYHNNKLGIKLYVGFAMLVSVLFALNGNFVVAAETAGVATTVGVLGGTFGKCFGPVAQSSMASLDVSSAMALASIVSIIVEYVPTSFFESIGLDHAKEYSFGLLDYWPVRVLCIVWFVISWLSRSSMFSESVGVCLENIESFIGLFVNMVVVISQILANVPLKNVASAATTTMSDAATASSAAHINNTHAIFQSITTHSISIKSAAYTVISALICFIVLIFCAVAFFFVRIFCFYVDVLLVPVCSFIPCSALAVNIGKFLIVLAMGLCAIFLPYIFLALYLLILIIAIVCFRSAYAAMKYYYAIYTKPLFWKMCGYREDMAIIPEQLPKTLYKKENLSHVQLAIPVYLHKYHNYDMRRHEKCYFIKNGANMYLCKPRRGKKENYRVGITERRDRFYIKKSLFYYEVFHVKKGEENIGKNFRRLSTDVHFVFSKEYYYRYEEIKNITGFIDYNEYRKACVDQNKLERREKRELKCLERQEKYELKRLEREKTREMKC